jgi:hypothetical protein
MSLTTRLLADNIVPMGMVREYETGQDIPGEEWLTKEGERIKAELEAALRGEAK